MNHLCIQYFLFVLVIVTWKQVIAVNMTGCNHIQPYPLVFDGTKQPKGDIYSPGFDEDGYPDDTYCDYTIKAPPGYIIKLTFKEMELETEVSCAKDKLYILDGPSMDGKHMGAYCGLEPPPYPIYSTLNGMHLSFNSDYQVRKKGFHAQYEVISPSEICPPGSLRCRNNRCYTHSDKCNRNDDCGDGTDEEKCGYPIGVDECGHGRILPIESSMFGRDRIHGGIVARPGSWPWQADLQKSKFYPNSHVCGGTLINSQWVMTAHHCLMGNPYPKNWKIHLGSHRKYVKDPEEQIRYVERIVTYPGYTGDEILSKPIDMTHDIALMKLNAPVKISDYVRPACLPPAGYDVPVGTKCIATGWGLTRGTGNDNLLKQAELFVKTEKVCPAMHPNTMICVKSEGSLQDICHGDSGGPLACKINGKWHVLGITSYGISSNMMTGLCAAGELGSVFNKVSAKINFINEMVEKYG